MRYVKYIGEDDGALIGEQLYPVVEDDTHGWFIDCNKKIMLYLFKHEAVEVTGFTKVFPTELMLEANLIEAYKQKALKLHEEGEIVSWEYLMVEAIKEGLK